jgi:hypothetical protein
MAKKQSTQPAQSVETEVKSTLNLVTILEELGITCTVAQMEALSERVVVKKAPRGSTVYKSGQIKLTAEDKIPLQMRIILENFEDGMTLEQIATKVATDKRFTTKQPVSKIVAYYRKQMIDRGYIQPAA